MIVAGRAATNSRPPPLSSSLVCAGWGRT